MRPGKKHLGILICIAAILVAAYFSINLVMDALVHSNKEIEVPNITGMPLSEALDVLAPLNLSVAKEGEEYNNTLPAGTIVRQTPPESVRVREGKVIKVIISKDSQNFVVPDLRGKIVASAISILTRDGLRMEDEVIRRYSLLGAKDIVVAQDPPPGTPTAKGAAVTLIISAGPPPPGIILMPDLLGKTLDAAVSWAGRENVTLEITRERAEGQDQIIINQSPAPDTDITDSPMVNITVTEGAQN
jgi:serine/threonine-protein kinase